MEISINKEVELGKEVLCKLFLHSNRPRFILGRNIYAKSVAELITVDGFIDEYTSEEMFMGKPIITNLAFIPQNAIVLSCNVHGRPITVQNKLQELLVETIDYFAFLKYCKLPIKSIDYWKDFADYYLKNKDSYSSLYNSLADEESKNTFEKIVNFRLSYDLSFMDGFTNCEYRQYFEDFLQLQPNGEVFVDVGGYDGYTSKEFIKRCPQFEKIYFFEPESKNINTAKNELQKYSNIVFFEKGLSNRTETLRFEHEKGSGSKVSETGSTIIEVDCLDNLIKDRVTYIKMDIEGSESIALEGAKQTILNYHPRLAICVYHKPNDLIDIPNQVLAIRKDYTIYLRQYTEGTDEIVMFFMPKK